MTQFYHAYARILSIIYKIVEYGILNLRSKVPANVVSPTIQTGDVQMEKVNIFTSATTEDGFDDLATKVDGWLAKNDGKIQIVSRHVTTAAGTNIIGDAFVNCTIAIFYRPTTR